jgi:hypothetical protein
VQEHRRRAASREKEAGQQGPGHPTSPMGTPESPMRSDPTSRTPIRLVDGRYNQVSEP